MASNVNSITGYVNEHSNELLGKAVIAGKTAKLFNLYAGIKGAQKLNLLDTTINFADGTSCDWTDTTTQTLSQRTLTPAFVKVNSSICWRAFQQTWLNYGIKAKATSSDVPFAEYFAEELVKGVQAELEKLLWQGDTTSTGNLSYADGIIKIMHTDGVAANKYTVTSGDTAADVINNVYDKIPAAAFEKGEVVMYVGSDMYRQYVKGLMANGTVIFNQNSVVADNIAMPNSMIIPGTNVRIEGVDGLNGTKKAYASYAENFIFGTDMEGDSEEFKMWVSEDNNNQIRIAVSFMAGTQVAYPDMVAYAE